MAGVGLDINITVQNLDGAERVLNNLAEHIAHPDMQLMRRLGDVGLEDIDKRFMTRGYGTWPPLSPATVARKGNDFVLIDTGAMFQSVRVGKAIPGSVSIEVPYGGRRHDSKVPGYHQTGTSRMPQRKIVEVTPLLQNAIVQAALKWLDNMLRALTKAV